MVPHCSRFTFFVVHCLAHKFLLVLPDFSANNMRCRCEPKINMVRPEAYVGVNCNVNRFYLEPIPFHYFLMLMGTVIPQSHEGLYSSIFDRDVSENSGTQYGCENQHIVLRCVPGERAGRRTGMLYHAKCKYEFVAGNYLS